MCLIGESYFQVLDYTFPPVVRCIEEFIQAANSVGNIVKPGK